MAALAVIRVSFHSAAARCPIATHSACKMTWKRETSDNQVGLVYAAPAAGQPYKVPKFTLLVPLWSEIAQ